MNRPYRIKTPLSLLQETKAKITSAVPLLFRITRHSKARYRAHPAQPTWFGVQLGGDMPAAPTLPRTKRQLSEDGIR